VSESQDVGRRLLEYRWADFKCRFGAVEFVDDDVNPVCESNLSDDDKRTIIARYTGRAPISLIDLTPERQLPPHGQRRLRHVLQQLWGDR
jgi:hypothetical protein